MASSDLILLGGARYTGEVARWLTSAGHAPSVVWAARAERTELGLPVLDTVPEAAHAILDATHAFDDVTGRAALKVVPGARYEYIARPLWEPTPEDRWTQFDSLQSAVAALPPGARVFAATGRESLPMLSCHDGPVFLRQLTEHDGQPPYANATYVFGAAPFVVSEEIDLLRALEIDVVLARNMGGTESFPKLAAARALGLLALLVRPPARPAGQGLQSEAEVRAWVQKAASCA